MNRDDDAGDLHDDPALAELRWRDEILQLMYWLQAEGLLADATADDLRRFLDGDPGRLTQRLEQLAQQGYLEAIQEHQGRYRLSHWGVEEGRRRFVDEFAPFLGRESHIACGDPECECHTSGETCTRSQERRGPS